MPLSTACKSRTAIGRGKLSVCKFIIINHVQSSQFSGIGRKPFLETVSTSRYGYTVRLFRRGCRSDALRGMRMLRQAVNVTRAATSLELADTFTVELGEIGRSPFGAIQQ